MRAGRRLQRPGSEQGAARTPWRGQKGSSALSPNGNTPTHPAAAGQPNPEVLGARKHREQGRSLSPVGVAQSKGARKPGVGCSPSDSQQRTRARMWGRGRPDRARATGPRPASTRWFPAPAPATPRSPSSTRLSLLTLCPRTQCPRLQLHLCLRLGGWYSCQGDHRAILLQHCVPVQFLL